MKKIIMAVAAIAMVVSAFAADVTAGTRIDGSLFKYDGGVHALQEGNGSQDYAMPNFQFGASGDQAGATVKITTQANDEPKLTTQTIWFKPIDMLKITVGNGDVALNKETIDWTGSTTGIDGRGFYIELRPIDALSIDVVLTHNANGWFLDAGALSRMYFKAAFSADFGSIGAYADISPKEKMEFGAGWKNGGALGPVNTLFINAIGCFTSDFGLGEIRGEVFANMGFDAVGLGVYVIGGYVGENAWIPLNDWWRLGISGVQNHVYVGTVLKLSFPVGSMGGYVYVKENDFLADSFGIEIKPGLTGSVGAMGWELAIDANIGGGVSINVPFILTMGF